MKKCLNLLLLTLFPLSVHAFCFQEAGQRYAVSPWLLWAIAKAESNLDPSSINRNRNGTVDVGLMQINSIWAGQLGGFGLKFCKFCPEATFPVPRLPWRHRTIPSLWKKLSPYS